jgi:antitoxin component YwqK of YwqJK toxin-antitoxin module
MSTIIKKYDNGVIKSIGVSKKGVKTGIHIKYNRDGNVYIKQVFRNGKLHGLFEKFHPNGLINYRVSFRYGKKYGNYNSWYIDGSNNVTCYFIDDFLVGHYEKRFRSCNLEISCFYSCELVFKKIKKSSKENLVGPYKEYYENGTVKKSCLYKDGVEISEEVHSEVQPGEDIIVSSFLF